MSTVTIKNLTKSFGSSQVLKEFNEVFRDGEFVTLLGPSGCGKTTMLRMIAGFEIPTTGEIWIDDKLVSGGKTFIPPEKRSVGMVFQSYAVWPHMNVFDNVAYPLTIKKVPKAEIKKSVEHVLEIVHLSQYAERFPNQLSGGQQQRVALARALVAAPKLLLLDEPLSNLDAKLRESMRFEIKEIQRQLGITVVYVTHDQTEAMAMSDRIFLINRGVVQQSGTPQQIYNEPANQFVADFLGKVDFFKGEVRDGRIVFPAMNGQSIPYAGPRTGKVEVSGEKTWLDGGNSVCMHAYPHFPGDLESQSACALGAVLKPDDTMIFATGMSTTCMAPFQPFWFDAFSIRQVFPYARQEDAVKSWILSKWSTA